MQLDRTEIVIRQRSAFELMDLSLLVLKRHAKLVILTSALFGVPLMLINILSVAWMLNEDSYLAAEHLSDPRTAMGWRHFFHIILLYVVQFQIVSLPTTIFLGNQIFYEEISVQKVLAILRPIVFRPIIVLGIMRLGLVSLGMEFLVNRSVAFDMFAEFWLLVVVSGIALFIRACWPFAPEILGLELCPLRSANGNTITYGQRSRGLHKLLMSDHIARFIGASFFSILLAMMLLGTMLFIKGVSTGDWMWNAWFDHLFLPLTLWMVGLYMAVFRFLSYLDSRIRLEGWEIELRLRAEAERLAVENRPPAVANVSNTEPSTA